jgi:hypothetical protein
MILPVLRYRDPESTLHSKDGNNVTYTGRMDHVRNSESITCVRMSNKCQMPHDPHDDRDPCLWIVVRHHDSNCNGCRTGIFVKFPTADGRWWLFAFSATPAVSPFRILFFHPTKKIFSDDGTKLIPELLVARVPIPSTNLYFYLYTYIARASIK